MAFGALLDTGTATTTNITDPFSVVSGGGLSVSVAVGDLVIAVLAQVTNLTVTAVTDNLGNTYVASNAGTDAGGVSGRMFYSRVTAAGTLNSVNFDTTASANNAAAAVAVFEGPFVVSPVDANPANTTADVTTPHACPVTGTLTQASELVVSWLAQDNEDASIGAGVGTLAVQVSVTDVSGAISYTVTSATTSVAHTFTTTAGAAAVLTGTTSFKEAASAGQPAAKRTGGVRNAGDYRRASGGMW